MVKKTYVTGLLQIALGLMLVAGLFPVSGATSVQAGAMDTIQRMKGLYPSIPIGDNIPIHCCDTDRLSHLVCDLGTCGFIVSEPVTVTNFVGTYRIAYSIFAIQFNYPKLTAPPPKI